MESLPDYLFVLVADKIFPADPYRRTQFIIECKTGKIDYYISATQSYITIANNMYRIQVNDYGNIILLDYDAE